jgi:hypothetical protein
VTTCCPAKVPYVITTGFPAKPVEEEDQTLEAGGLLNAVLILK